MKLVLVLSVWSVFGLAVLVSKFGFTVTEAGFRELVRAAWHTFSRVVRLQLDYPFIPGNGSVPDGIGSVVGLVAGAVVLAMVILGFIFSVLWAV